jgi:hypothetical protein
MPQHRRLAAPASPSAASTTPWGSLCAWHWSLLAAGWWACVSEAAVEWQPPPAARSRGRHRLLGICVGPGWCSSAARASNTGSWDGGSGLVAAACEGCKAKVAPNLIAAQLGLRTARHRHCQFDGRLANAPPPSHHQYFLITFRKTSFSS